MLDYFEEELGHEGRVGRWLGGGQICVADITLGGYHNIIEGSKITFLHTVLFTGLYLHRLYQLGLDTAYYQGDTNTSEEDDAHYTCYIAEGVRPHLSVFYQSIKSRTSFKEVLRWQEHEG